MSQFKAVDSGKAGKIWSINVEETFPGNGVYAGNLVSGLSEANAKAIAKILNEKTRTLTVDTTLQEGQGGFSRFTIVD